MTPDDVPIDEDDLLLVIEAACTAANAEKFNRLMEGDLSYHDGDDSRADEALCTMLAYWCWHTLRKKSKEIVDRLFRLSKLYREKWERADYREDTLNKAFAYVCSEEAAA
jgi:primase-polymerase (primpol)-like protein